MSRSANFVVVLTAIAVVGTGLAVAAPRVLAGRTAPGLALNGVPVGGLDYEHLPQAVATLGDKLAAQPVTLSLRGTSVTVPLAEIGASLDADATIERLRSVSWAELAAERGSVEPVIRFDEQQLQAFTRRHFDAVATLPRNAGLEINQSGRLVVVPAQTGESIESAALSRELVRRVRNGQWEEAVGITVVTTAPSVTDDEVAPAQAYAARLLQQGLVLQFADQSWTMKPYTIRRLLRFVEQPETQNHNLVLGLKLDETELAAYLDTTLAPEINQTAQDARFVKNGDRVEQFALSREGRLLDTAQSVQAINDAIVRQAENAVLAVNTVLPTVRDSADITNLGITDLVARGVTDFAGSPANRRHNIEVGTSRYHGLLIAPNEEFSFNKYLGPVDGEHGFLPELVIKNHVTTPEFGGGLCQVSTTAFRAAAFGGLKITQRRNHAYAVRYYGEPGFDATIYPPYTDLRFVNNTPGYLLIQARVEGTKVTFELWGTDDGRKVAVEGPTIFDRQNGVIKTKLTQRVTQGDAVVIEDSFYSRYQPPELFPKVLTAQDPPQTAAAAPSPSPAPGAPAPSPNDQSKPLPTRPASDSASQ